MNQNSHEQNEMKKKAEKIEYAPHATTNEWGDGTFEYKICDWTCTPTNCVNTWWEKDGAFNEWLGYMMYGTGKSENLGFQESLDQY